MNTFYNGTYTITAPSGEHRTFRVKTQAGDANFAPGQRIVELLVGQDNENDYKGFGFVSETGIQVYRRFRDNGKSFHELAAKMLWSLGTEGEASGYYAKGCRLLLEKRCMRCNRKLTNPTSILTGIGPECAGRM